jgi:hypothetical protein
MAPFLCVTLFACLTPSGYGDVTRDPLLEAGLVVTQLHPLKLVRESFFVSIEVPGHRLLIDSVTSLIMIVEGMVSHARDLFLEIDSAQKVITNDVLCKLAFLLGEIVDDLDLSDPRFVSTNFDFLSLANTSETSDYLSDHWSSLLNTSLNCTVRKEKRDLLKLEEKSLMDCSVWPETVTFQM